MSWLLFMDESGHDHKSMPYEVRGGIALHAEKLWPFVQDLHRVELAAFGTELAQFKTELKGSKLLNRDRYKWAGQAALMQDEARRKHCRGFLTKGLEKKVPTREEFTAYGQACLEMARGVFQLLREHRAVLFAAAIPKSVARPSTFEADEYLRKDHVFLLERFFYFLEHKREHGILVMDEVDKTDDRRFVRRLESYFMRTQTGRYRAQWIVPTPFFVSSDMSYPVQAADLCMYCVNWGFRVASIGMTAAARAEIADEFGPWLKQMQFEGDGYRDGNVFRCFGVVHVPDPYTSR
jgi:hypothetical protein